ncbi:DNA mismatch repair protein Mlh3-like isoform X2 [Athalia rosae]|uniref:DNA mismatch repair protein Mlh3-like isoform X2 n=1 Tax=Athalia rosae TaxID=37344 RepID=UPI002033EA00|nr:DNA mismatch repair protein Mlh3-like isoform X2 [Athalia rosae]
MDYKEFESMSRAVPKLFRDSLSGVLKYGGQRKQEQNGEKFRLGSQFRRQDVQVRQCLAGSVVNEFKFDKNLFSVIEVIQQINDNFIAAVALSRQNKKVLLLLDQHAIHERIRYDNLLRDYTSWDRKSFIPANLSIPIIFSDQPIPLCNWILEHSKEVHRSGLRIRSEKMGYLTVTSIPKCFDRRRFHQNRTELERVVKKLLNDIASDLKNNHWNVATTPRIPMTIHNAIATEACHGAIKFNEKMNVDQCTELVRLLMDTEAPSRCAHGRPSVIPLLELEASKIQTQLFKRISGVLLQSPKFRKFGYCAGQNKVRGSKLLKTPTNNTLVILQYNTAADIGKNICGFCWELQQ